MLLITTTFEYRNLQSEDLASRAGSGRCWPVLAASRIILIAECSIEAPTRANL